MKGSFCNNLSRWVCSRKTRGKLFPNITPSLAAAAAAQEKYTGRLTSTPCGYSRRKISNDPNNTKWTRDETTFGQKILRSQGWQPGQFLGVQNAPHSELHTAANASYIRVVLKDDMKGLGFNKARDDEVTGLDVFSDLLSRLNGRSEEAIEGDKAAKLAVKTNFFVAQKYGAMRFVSGGLLVGDKLFDNTITEEEEEESKDNQGDAKMDDVPAVSATKKSKKDKKRKATEDEDDEDDSSSKKKRRRDEGESSRSKKDKKKSKKDKSKSEPASEDDDTATSDKKKKRKSKKSKDGSEDDDDVKDSKKKSKKDKKEKKERKKEKKEKKKRRKEAGSSSDDDSTDSSASEKNTGTSTPVTSGSGTGTGTSTPLGNRNFVRSRFIAQKRQAVMDATALKQIFMLKA